MNPGMSEGLEPSIIRAVKRVLVRRTITHSQTGRRERRRPKVQILARERQENVEIAWVFQLSYGQASGTGETGVAGE